ncbi:MAG: flagellar hook-length control protein FliK [Betaproteobacteria bacterium]|nr:flagellar hook-length control protein FliK [Betaproteobacteria bacterium]
MIHNDVLNQLQLLVKTSAPPLVDVAQTPLEEPLWVPGQRLSAVVLSNMPNGRFQVQVGEQVLDMNLPRNTQPGEQVELTFVSNQPRLTFVLTRDLAVAIPGTATPADAKVQVTVSDSARYLGALLQKISDQGEAKVSSLTSTTPLLSSGPVEIKEFAATLRGALSQSGLFYESHQAQWVAGERNLADLMREPQGKFMPFISSSPQSDQAAAVSKDAFNTPQPANAPGSPVPTSTGAGTGSLPVQSLMDGAMAQGAARFPVHAEAVSLVQQQLQTLDSHQLVWQGQVWQGQTMEWRVEERGAREGGSGGEGEEPPQWQTSLRLQLPKLGDVQAALVFTPQGVRINLKAADSGTAEAMKEAQGKLLGSMQASGLHVLAMSVERHEKV